MGNSWPGAREDPDRQAAHGAGETAVALALLRERRGAQWTTDMEALVEYHVRSTWVGPYHKETQHQWAARLCAAYDDQEPAMRDWLDRRLGASEGQGKERRNQAPDGPGEPPRGADREEPGSDPGQPQGTNGGQWSQDRGWSRPRSSGWNESAETPNRADYPRADPWGSRSAWSSGRMPSDPWHTWGGQGPQGTQGEATGGAPNDPWSSYANRQQRQEPQEEQRTEEDRQPEQAPAEHHAPADPGQLPAWRAPWWEEDWLAGKTHTEMRYGDWR